MDEQRTVGRYMRCPAACTIEESGLSVATVAERLEESGTGIVFVVSGPALVGIVTSGDIRRILTGDGQCDARTIVNRSPTVVDPSDDVSVALRTMLDGGISVLPVVAAGLVGYITLSDIASLFSPERVYLVGDGDDGDQNHLKHLSRYRFASMFVGGGTVLDCACGSGYGSTILATKADRVISVDVSSESIDFAVKNNASPKIEYSCKPLQHLDFEPRSLRTVVSLETLEHVSKADMVAYLRAAAGWIEQGGCFVGSSPMLRFRDGKPYVTNPYHVNELERSELVSTVLGCLKGFSVNFFYQDVWSFPPLGNERTGFCVFVARKHGVNE